MFWNQNIFICSIHLGAAMLVPCFCFALSFPLQCVLECFEQNRFFGIFIISAWDVLTTQLYIAEEQQWGSIQQQINKERTE